MICRVRRFILTVEGPNWTDSYEVELAALPNEGEPIETRYGTCLVTKAEPLPDGSRFAGKVVCRYPA